MSTDESSVAGLAAGAVEAPARPAAATNVVTILVWLAGSAVVVAAQPGLDRKAAAAAAAAAGVATILVVSLLTADPSRRYLRSLIGAAVAVSVTSAWLLSELLGPLPTFRVSGLEKRIVLPLLFVLVAPLALRLVPARMGRDGLATSVRRLCPLDWIVVAYALLAVPALALGFAHHASKTYIAQDLGLVAFFVLMYAAGRLVAAETARAYAGELVALLVLLAVAQAVLFVTWEPEPLYSYAEPAAAAAIAGAVLAWRSARWLAVGLGVTLLAADVTNIRSGSNSTTAILLAGALGILGYLLLRLWPRLPRWVLVTGAVAVLAVFVAFTSDGATVRGQYHGADPSNRGRTFEAQQVRAEVRSSSLSLVLGRGLGATIDESHAPPAFRGALTSAGRDLAHVPEIHLLEYQFLLEFGLLGAVWLAAFLVSLGWASVRGLERAVTERDASYVIYAALPLLATTQAFAAASHLQDNPLIGLTLGALVTLLGSAGFRRAATD